MSTTANEMDTNNPLKQSINMDNPMLVPFNNIPTIPGQSLRQMSEGAFYVVNEIVTKRLGHIPILKVFQF
jgi:hypothetical protein